MAIIQKKDLKNTNKTELKAKLLELRKDLMKLNAQVAMGTTPKSPGIVRETKKTIARIITILNKKAEETKKDE